MSLKITEIFYSIQGESAYSGHPTVFVRLTGCPMRCSYCDTAYAFHGGKRLELDEILQIVDQHKTQYVTVTGGEPLAQPDCWPLMSQLCDAGYKVSLETGGAVSIRDVDPRVHIVLDVKTPDSGEEHNNTYHNLDLIQAKDTLKFVICSRNDYEWSRQKVLDKKLADSCEILFSPSSEQLNPTDLANWILADHVPVRLQIQLHKILWQDSQGK
jgi:7-carboxy-7-deazaguanine synthase